MWIYLGLLLLPLAVGLSSAARPPVQRAVFVVTFLLLLVAIGLRQQIGCDWNPYQYMFVTARSAQWLPDALATATIGYMFLNWLVAQTGLGIAGVNLVCALVLLTGIYAFCRIQPRPWIAFLVCTPILLLLAGFNATRQGVAAGFFLYCLYLHQTGRSRWAIVPLLLVAGTFHITAFALLPLYLAIRIGGRIPLLAVVLAAAVGGVVLALAAPYLPGLPPFYKPAGGAVFRIIPTLLALLCLPLVWSRAELPAAEREMLKWLAGMAAFCIGLGLYSTMVMDRVNYYVVPFQVLVFCRLSTLAATRFQRVVLDSAIAAPFIILLAAWLAFTDSDRCMDPYRSYLTNPQRLLGAGASIDYQLRYDPQAWGHRGPPERWPEPIPAPGSGNDR